MYCNCRMIGPIELNHGVEVPYKWTLAGRQFPAEFLHLTLLSGLTLMLSFLRGALRG